MDVFKLFLIVSGIVFVFITFILSYIKFRGQKNYEKKMTTYKSLAPGDKVVIVHNKNKFKGFVMYGSSEEGYIIHIGDEIVNINFSKFVNKIRKQ